MAHSARTGSSAQTLSSTTTDDLASTRSSATLSQPHESKSSQRLPHRLDTSSWATKQKITQNENVTGGRVGQNAEDTEKDASLQEMHSSTTTCDPASLTLGIPYDLDRLNRLEAENKALRVEAESWRERFQGLQREEQGQRQAVEEERNGLLASFQTEYAAKEGKLRELEGLLDSLRIDQTVMASLRNTKADLETKIGTITSIIGDDTSARTPTFRPESTLFARLQRSESFQTSATTKRRSMRRFDSGANSLRPLQLVTTRTSQSAPTSALSPLNSAQNQALLALEGKARARDDLVRSSIPKEPTQTFGTAQLESERLSWTLTLAKVACFMVIDETPIACLPPVFSTKIQPTTLPCRCISCKEPTSRRIMREWAKKVGLLHRVESLLESLVVASRPASESSWAPTDSRLHGDSGYVSPELAPATAVKVCGRGGSLVDKPG